MTNLETLRMFFRSFSTSPMYDTGFSDAINGSGATDAETTEDMIKALAFINGYAQACRIANVYMTTPWQVANLVAIAAGILGTLLEGADPTGRNRQIDKLCEQYARELTALIGERRAS